MQSIFTLTIFFSFFFFNDTATTEIYTLSLHDALPILAGLSYERLERGGIQWPCPSAEHPGTPILHKERFTRGLGKFTPLTFREPLENPDEDYPFTLNTGRILQHWHGGTMSRRSEGLDWVVPEGEIQINDKDGLQLGVETGELIRV